MSGSTGTSSYLTVAQEASDEVLIEKSRFIAHVCPVTSKEDAEAFISSIKAEYKDATHNVPAYVVGPSQEIMWSSEDGEPQGTAGTPVLKMLVQEGMTDVCIVTTRYFGGIKLGTGGLVRAYTQVAKLALAKAGKAMIKDMLLIHAGCDYKSFNRINTFDFEGEAEVRNAEFLDRVVFDVVTSPENETGMEALLTDISGGSCEILEKMIIQDKIMC